MSTALHKRLSISSHRSQSPGLSRSPTIFANASNADAEEWINAWAQVSAKDLVDSPVVSVPPDCSVEDACEKLLSESLMCLAVESRAGNSNAPYSGLFDVRWADVNAFLTLAATRHTLSPDELREKPILGRILTAAKAGHVPVDLVSNLSEKNALETLPQDANLISLLGIFSGGCHRVLIYGDDSSKPWIGFVSDRKVLSYLGEHAKRTRSLQAYFENPLNRLALPSLNLFASIVATTADSTTLEAMKLMNDEGVSSVAVLEEVNGTLLSAIVVPSQSNEILTMPLRRLITMIRSPLGSTDGEERYPVYSVTPSSTLSYTVQKLIATDAHRLFVTSDASSSPSTLTSPNASGHLTGVVSIIDSENPRICRILLSLFGRIANIPDVDPTRLQRHRRMSSSSSRSSRSSRSTGDFDPRRSRSGSRTSDPRIAYGSPVARSPVTLGLAGNRNSVGSMNLGD
ncbi:hypothetical protein PUNSTDRAFT_44773 [Punctularia strigosozonata HHB-11173 SS5]|uniref:uncharacterized protein n=1 Tax=Punctularia strigosozonata (strain HHB-11173) TaxID=741275 RepID=UPI0004417709|nr:uncharacterized protein PUNSTDRAFT_44773 [Punctularia strigosozonata HHB-11173 SS5]EIN08199.1 hypothetical protein PUNSTDRAFT_44773 [Punctularia strigosozonata HHB-11173 SS5]